MNADVSSKVFAIVMEDFEGKGPHKFELTNNRFRTGFGKVNIKFIPPEGVSAVNVKNFFGVSESAATADTNVHVDHDEQVSFLYIVCPYVYVMFMIYVFV